MMRIDSARIINAQKLKEVILEAFEDWAEIDINKEHWDAQFKNMDRWKWTGGETRRKNGALVDTPRDIYDLGALYRSGVDSYKFTDTGTRAEAYWLWDAKNSSGEEYASHVHYGTKFMDGRPFTDDISIESSFWLKTPGQSLMLRMQAYLDGLNAR